MESAICFIILWLKQLSAWTEHESDGIVSETDTWTGCCLNIAPDFIR